MRAAVSKASVALLLLAAAAAWSRPAAAQPAAPPMGPSESKSYGGPNIAVLVTGLLALGVGYFPALAISSSSTNQADGKLGVPVLGPWLDLGARNPCGPGSVSCKVEPGNIALVAIDGAIQTWGLFATVASFFVSSKSVPKSAFRVLPSQVGVGGYGVTAVGTF